MKQFKISMIHHTIKEKQVRLYHSIFVLLSYFILTFLLSSCSISSYLQRRSVSSYEKLNARVHYVETKEATIAFREVKSSDSVAVLVLIHGFGPLPGYQWKKVVKRLHHDFTIIVPDLIYFGKSHSNDTSFSPQFQSEQLALAMDQLGYEKYYVAGLSYGGMVASLMAHHHPSCVDGLILVDALNRFYRSEYSDSVVAKYNRNSIDEILLPQNAEDLKIMLKLTFHKPPPVPKFVMKKPAKELFANNRPQKQRMLEYMHKNELELTTGNYDYDGPIKIIWGLNDMLIPVSNAYELEDYYSNAEPVVVLDKTGHVPNMEKPKQVARVIKEFIND